MSNFSESNTVQMVKNNYYFAKAAINSVEGETPFIRGIKKTGITIASGVIGLANLPITILKDEIQPDTIIRKTLGYTYNNLKNVVHSKDSDSEKINVLGVIIVMSSIVNAVALPISLMAAPLKGLMGESKEKPEKTSVKAVPSNATV